MKTICMPVDARADLLRKTLDSLSKNKSNGWQLLACVEPKGKQSVDICESVDFMERMVIVNGMNLGIKENSYKCLSEAVSRGAEKLLYLESDILVSPDLLEMADWFFENCKIDNLLCLNFVNYESNGSRDKVIINHSFSSLCFACSSKAWTTYMKPAWRGQFPWDVNVAMMMKEKNLVVAHPTLSRSRHIGWNDDDEVVEYTEVNINEEPGPFKYKLVA